jgi:hypothetical protein
MYLKFVYGILDGGLPSNLEDKEDEVGKWASSLDSVSLLAKSYRHNIIRDTLASILNVEILKRQGELNGHCS